MSYQGRTGGDDEIVINLSPEAIAKAIIADHGALSILVVAVRIELLKNARGLLNLLGKYAGK